MSTAARAPDEFGLLVPRTAILIDTDALLRCAIRPAALVVSARQPVPIRSSMSIPPQIEFSMANHVRNCPDRRQMKQGIKGPPHLLRAVRALGSGRENMTRASCKISLWANDPQHLAPKIRSKSKFDADAEG